PARLADFGRRTESLGQALAEALAGKGTRARPVPAGAHRLPVGEHTLVMGVVNVTPDSFSGDGIADDVDAAVAPAVGMAAAGADAQPGTAGLRGGRCRRLRRAAPEPGGRRRRRRPQ